MKARRLRPLPFVLFFALAVIALLAIPAPAMAGWSVQQLTANTYSDVDPRVNGGYVAWGVSEELPYLDGFYLYEIATGRTMQWASVQSAPQIDDGRMVWGTVDNEIYLYDIPNGRTTLITADGGSDPCIDGGYVVWQGSDEEIYLYEIANGQTTRVTENAFSDHAAQIDNGYVVWQQDQQNAEIYLYDISSGQTIRLTQNTSSDFNPRIDSGYVVWQQANPPVNGAVYLYDIASGQSRELASNTGSYPDPQIDDGHVVWFGRGTNELDWEIYHYDIVANQITQLSDNDYSDAYPQIDSGKVVWCGWGSTADWEIYLYDTANGQTTQLTDNVYDDEYPQIDAGQVVWRGFDGHDLEVFLAVEGSRLLAAEAGGPYTGAEGAPVTLDASASSNPDGGMFACAWDLDNDGAYDDADGVTCSVTFADNGVYSVGLQVTDQRGTSTIDTAEVTVANLAPTVYAGADTIVTMWGQKAQFFSIGFFTDPGQDSWTATVNWGDGTASETLDLNPRRGKNSTRDISSVRKGNDAGKKTFSLRHTFRTKGTYTVIVTVIDDDGGVGTDTVVVQVDEALNALNLWQRSSPRQ
ncbi:MAG: hypothetical protein JXA57_12305 [Armatimonadetes bacterium]|nr:hypothetical protein [Armatimonadota bacterium]